ncbi:TPA: hypothetical protein ACPDJE_001883 [Pasteurella multocida]|uniref:hypothetical protein n=1 Tax=Pasteurella multocida TaxID=747 RepID=UPI000F6FD359|nr:hypothetical protein [Pasteurella multocida]VEJ15734.1 uncharacterized phage protein [Pasteurella multocida subsp. septica]HDR1108748.1 hypothetical protein [Pasteurella multocida]HDR1129074.1 hypothetical protein [Pasteurella multocida]HDR1202817.1 hypothetical protein [Pasteurella multocida]HDR1254250.1 hypothetical protein [Pasteurella multocida]
MRAIELLIKMIHPKCVSIETSIRGFGNLGRDQIISLLNCAEKESPLGYHLLFAKYAGDSDSRKAISEYINQSFPNATESEKTGLNYVVDVISDIPLPTQIKRLRSLRNQHLRSKFSHIEATKRANKIAKEINLEKNSIEARQIRIRKFNDLRKSNMCPRCRGIGEIGRVQKTQCPSCDGKGRLIANISMIRNIVDCDESKLVQFEQLCYREMSKAEIAIKERLRKEIEE